VQTFNTAIQTIPTSLIAGMLGFKARAFFEAAGGERGAVQVRF
jgi:LemA protein